jgi:hypothetical protein
MQNVFTSIILLLAFAGWSFAQGVTLIPREQETRVDVEVDGKLFTSLRWDERIKRPVVLPVITVGGKFVTRGFPIETRDGEAIGHPHQVGASFSYGDVNGFDFWNTSTFRSEKELEKMGRIVMRKIISMQSGAGRGTLEYSSAWVDPKGNTLLTEVTKLVFNAKGKRRWIDRETVLTADVDVVFGDNKEGLFAIHLNTALQADDQMPAKVTTAAGVVSDRTSTKGLTGKYLNSEGLEGARIWGTPAKWAAVSGTIEGENVTVAVFDSPGNLNYPANTMVRPYGLLALNPFGQKAFVPANPERRFILAARRSVTLRHRLMIFPERVSKEKIDGEFRAYSGDRP